MAANVLRLMLPSPGQGRRLIDAFSKAAGQTLRDARIRRGLTLRDLAAASGQRFKASVVGGYERGERSISLERFCELATLYGVPPDRLLSDALARLQPAGREEVVIDLTKLDALEEGDRTPIAEFLYQVKAMRRDYLSDVVTLRAGDVEALALERRIQPSRLLTSLTPAIVADAPPSD